MDSKIREIEQRLAKAKTGLVEGGQEDYLQQLYLLDAEIRAVIIENGILPKAFSQGSRSRMRRRVLSPALGFGMSLGAIVLAATSTYAAFLFTSSDPQAAVPVISAVVDNTAAVNEDSVSLPQDTPSAVASPVTTVLLATQQADPILQANAEQTPVEDLANVAPGNTVEEQVASSPQVVIATPDIDAALMANFIPPMEDTPVYNSDPTAGGKVASSNTGGVDGDHVAGQMDGFNWTIARFALPGKNKKAETEEIEVVNLVKEQLSKSADSSE